MNYLYASRKEEFVSLKERINNSLIEYYFEYYMPDAPEDIRLYFIDMPNDYESLLSWLEEQDKQRLIELMVNEGYYLFNKADEYMARFNSLHWEVKYAIKKQIIEKRRRIIRKSKRNLLLSPKPTKMTQKRRLELLRAPKKNYNI